MPNELLKHFPADMHAILFSFFKLCWRQSKTPNSWKHGRTLLFYKKNDPTDPANYRPIALLMSVYKFWTRIITTILSDFCEQSGILSEPQEGFRKFKSSSRQLQYLKLVLEDAKLHKHDLNVSLLDIKSAFDTVDHHRLFAVLQALGIPMDAVRLIQDLYINATTSISTNHGQTPPISLRRGTIQGDSLSPLLFILFLEPLLRWLSINDRGYRCGSAPAKMPHYANSLAAADDLALLTCNVDQMQRQLDKVQLFAEWSGMQLAPSKCETSAVLWGTYASSRSAAVNWEIIEPMLQRLRVCGAPLKYIAPDQPFRYLGPLFTLTMDWKPNFKLMLDAIASKGLAIASSLGTVEQKLEIERSCTVGTLAYHFAIAPLSMAQLRALDAARARVIKRILRIASSAPSEMLYLPRSNYGCGVVSLAPIYAQVCADTFAATLNDLGRLGTLARAVQRSQMQKKAVTSLTNVPASWMSSNQHMQLRKASILNHAGLHVRYDCHWDPSLASVDLYEMVTTSIAAKALSAPLDQLHDHVVHPLWQAFGYTCTPFLTGAALHSLEVMILVVQRYPQQVSSFPVKRGSAYSLLLQICCNISCQLPSLLASVDVAPAPCQLTIIRGVQGALPPVLPAGCPANLPDILELSHVTQFVVPHHSDAVHGCHYQVAWCTGPMPPTRQLHLLERIGIEPEPHAVSPHSLHAAWRPSILHWSVLSAFWPGKLAAFEARQLHCVLQHDLLAQPGVDLQ